MLSSPDTGLAEGPDAWLPESSGHSGSFNGATLAAQARYKRSFDPGDSLVENINEDFTTQLPTSAVIRTYMTMRFTVPALLAISAMSVHAALLPRAAPATCPVDPFNACMKGCESSVTKCKSPPANSGDAAAAEQLVANGLW